MKPVFENKLTITKEMYRKAIAAGQTKQAKIMTYMNYGIYLIVFFAFASFAVKSLREGKWLAAVLNFIVFSLCLVRILVSIEKSSGKQYEKLRKLQGTDSWDLVLRFGHEKFEVQNGNSEAAYEYHQISRVEELSHTFVIWIGDQMMFPLGKDHFITGTSNEFTKFLLDKGIIVTKKGGAEA